MPWTEITRRQYVRAGLRYEQASERFRGDNRKRRRVGLRRPDRYPHAQTRKSLILSDGVMQCMPFPVIASEY